MQRLLPILALVLLSGSGCNLCWPRGGQLQTCDDDAGDDDAGDDDAGDDDAGDDDAGDDDAGDDDAGDDDAGDDDAGDDDAAPDSCLQPRTRPTIFDTVDGAGYGQVDTDSAALEFCWFTVADGVDQLSNDLSSAGATHAHDRIDWDVEFLGEVVPTVRLDIQGALNFEYQSARNPNNSCDFYSWDSVGVAAFWDDLNMTDPGAGDLRYGFVGQAPNRIAVAWWDGVFHDDFPGDPISFQVHLFEADQHIEVQYLDVNVGEYTVDGGRGATVGLRHDSAILVGCNQIVLRDEYTLAWWPPE